VDRDTDCTIRVEHPPRRLDRERTAAQLDCVCPGDAGDVGPTVYDHPTARRRGSRHEFLRQFQTADNWHTARTQVRGNRSSSSFEQRRDPPERVSSLEFGVGTHYVNSGDVYWNWSPS
jgi:hypothetical protein